MRPDPRKMPVAAIQARHLALTSAAYLKAVVSLLEQGEGSRGSHLVLSADGVEIHPSIIDQRTGGPLRFKRENAELRKEILRAGVRSRKMRTFLCAETSFPAARPPNPRPAFEPAWEEFRAGKIYQQ